MNRFLCSVLIIFFLFVNSLFISCKHDINSTVENNTESKINNSEDNKEESTKTNTASDSNIISNSFFWGTWVRMDNGKEYEILESSVLENKNTYQIQDSSEQELKVNTLGSFKKQSESVIICDNIPYFRKGGTNLEYSLKLVGFSTTTSRAASSFVNGIKGHSKSSKYKSFESEAESNSDGTITFTAPTANDTQTVIISTVDEEITIPELTIANTGDYMGTVALVDKDDYNLKITGTISDEQKDNGYLYGNNAKTYTMILTITNISENKCTASGCTIKSNDKNLIISSSSNLEGFAISTLSAGATKTIELTITYGKLESPYIDTGINVIIENPLTNQTWEDYIPLRFFKGTIPITIAAKNPENNNNAALNGFIIYPDGNNQFFAIPNNTSKVLYIPTFGKDKNYKLVFSGATVSSTLDDSTEMFYTVEPTSIIPKPVITEGMDAIKTYIPFGGNNHSENTAFAVTEGFEAYLNEGEIDYYSICADSDIFYGPDGSSFCSITYVNEKGSAPEPILLPKGTTLTSSQLPILELDDFEFLGWFDGENIIIEDNYSVNNNLTLTAKWNQIAFLVSFETDGGTSISSYITSSILDEPVTSKENFIFDGWYTNSNFSSDAIVYPFTVTTETKLYAKWLKKCSIYFETEYGTITDDFYIGAGKKLSSDILPRPREKGQCFIGWYLDKERTIGNEANGYLIADNITLYAKWSKYTPPTEDFVFVEGCTIEGSESYDNSEYSNFNSGVFIKGRTVTLSNYYICNHEITQGEYEDYCCYTTDVPNKKVGYGINYPVYYVSWYDAIVYCNLRSIEENLEPCYMINGETNPKKWPGIKNINDKYSCSLTSNDAIWDTIICDFLAKGYRLPTEAEWEFAARGGIKTYGTDKFSYYYSGATTTNFSAKYDYALDSVGWYSYNICNNGVTGDNCQLGHEEFGSHEIKLKNPNALGLYDMSGNVMELCWDWYGSVDTGHISNPKGSQTGTNRIARGGGCISTPAYGCSVSFRYSSGSPANRADCESGFRIVTTGE